MEPGDLILEWLCENEPPDDQVVGYETIEYTNNVYIVLAIRENRCPKYIGWFSVLKNKLYDNDQYTFCCYKDGLFLYRATHDYLPE